MLYDLNGDGVPDAHVVVGFDHPLNDEEPEGGVSADAMRYKTAFRHVDAGLPSNPDPSDGVLEVSFDTRLTSVPVNLFYGSWPGRTHLQLGMEYDAAANIVTRMTSSGDSLSYEYDATGRPVASATPEGMSLDYAYEPEFVSEFGGDHARGSRTRVLSVGLDYAWTDGLGRLSHAASDAVRVARTFGEAGSGGTVMLNERATPELLLAAIEREIRDSTDQDALVLYFAGHGVANAKGQRSVVLAGSSGHLSLVSVDALVNALGRHRGRVTLVVDGCAVIVNGLPQTRKPGGLEGVDAPITVLASTGLSQTAIEANELGSGLFTDLFLRGVRRSLRRDSAVAWMPTPRSLQQLASDTERVARTRYGVEQQPDMLLWRMGRWTSALAE